ncbi:MAG: hypothetical protein NTZ13_00360 [Candidatus Parcubacteria bacterium]|nr:hypothetical protein [Candidatus Parcubacteria bacterium]
MNAALAFVIYFFISSIVLIITDCFTGYRDALAAQNISIVKKIIHGTVYMISGAVLMCLMLYYGLTDLVIKMLT